jgi:4-hydroxybenzoate polyprenyltransferase
LSKPPLAVDLDGTLVRTDLLHESAIRALRDRPINALLIPFWTLRGKAFVKQKLAALTDFDPAHLPYHGPLLGWLKEQRAEGRHIVLCTAADASLATAVAGHVGLFDEVIASDGVTNLGGSNKAEALESRFGRGGFDYAGNQRSDLEIWRRAHGAIVVGAPTALAEAARTVCEVDRVFPPLATDLTTWRRTLRSHQWLKNLLLFVPMLAAHRLTDQSIWMSLLIAFFSFSLCASAVYIANDLFDLDSDRKHPRKRSRPFAAGSIPVALGVVLAPLLLVVSFVSARYTTDAFVAWLTCYLFLTSAYSWLLKRVVLLDCLTLAMLYTVRIVAGAAAASMDLSFWLLAFAVFLFLSLAFVKRYAELESHETEGKVKMHGRGYYQADLTVIQSLGITAGYASTLVLALYLNTDTVVRLYRTPQVIWGTVPVMLFWISWIWLKAHRGEMHDDPMIFAVKDKASLASGLAFASVVYVASLDIAW